MPCLEKKEKAFFWCCTSRWSDFQLLRAFKGGTSSPKCSLKQTVYLHIHCWQTNKQTNKVPFWCHVAHATGVTQTARIPAHITSTALAITNRMYQNSTLKQATTASFHIIYNSLFQRKNKYRQTFKTFQISEIEPWALRPTTITYL